MADMSTGRPIAAAAGMLMALLTLSAPAAGKRLLWGDTHLHSSYSADAYLHGNFTADPATAYRYAQGEPVVHPYHGARVQIGTPLDFLVVADHAEFLGGIRLLHRDAVESTGWRLGERLGLWGARQMFNYALRDGYGMDFFDGMSATPGDPRAEAARLRVEPTPSLPGQARIVATAWAELARTADTFNRPGEFTALIGWEWTACPGGANLHRVVLTDGDADSAASYLPYSRFDSDYPEDLWRWLEQTSSASGADFVAIPHNANISKGFMFPLQTLRGGPLTPGWLALRSRWEPVVEATQFKGDSETHPDLSPADPFADFERYTWYIQAAPEPYRPQPGDFVRSALRRGLAIERDTGINPYRFGLIGSTDSHTGMSSAEENNFYGKLTHDSIPANKGRDMADDDGAAGWDLSASGLAAVWAEDNTRAAILAALKRREVYATTGPRIAVRVAAGWGNGDAAVPMGAVLPALAAPGAVPTLAITAQRDPVGANLDRIQVVKGWIDAAGETHEQVYDAAWSGGRAAAANGTLPPVGNTVDVQRASYRNSIGAPELAAVWSDRDFDPAQAAFYYVRVLEIPTPRHSLLDMVALDIEPRADWPTSIQERAYTSPVWYRP